MRNTHMNKYGKTLSDVIDFKKIFLNDDLQNKEYAFAKNELYKKQPLRKFCKVCGNKLGAVDFYKNDIGYMFCDICEHLNGERDDTQEFVSQLYSLNGGGDYSKKYLSFDESEYNSRVEKIYNPKAKFLIDSISDFASSDPLEYKFCDIGAGSGYFISALIKSGVDADNLTGVEVSAAQTSYANTVLRRNIVKNIDIGEMLTTIKNLNVKVVSLIGVLEHLQNPIEVIEQIKSNKNIKYLFISVPLFSPTVLFEMIFTEVTDRHLTGGHTHLFTDKSLSWIENKFCLERLSSWWFGMDIFDLYRSMMITFKKNQSLNSSNIFSDYFIDIVDDLQLAIDKKKKSSEVHILYRM